jgi:hypothetical protein
MDTFIKIISIISGLFTIAASSIAIYLFFWNKEKIKNALNILLNYSHQLTLADLKYKIERLNDYTVNDSVQRAEVINILYEIEGQIIGNKLLKVKLNTQLAKIEGFNSNSKTISEAKKRSLVSELRESLRHLDVSNYNNLIDPN